MLLPGVGGRSDMLDTGQEGREIKRRERKSKVKGVRIYDGKTDAGVQW